ncbi:MAG: sigma-54-dependent Fis family transcriptional regulator [Bacteroidales bacterium]
MKHDVIKQSHLRSMRKGIEQDLLFPHRMLSGKELQSLLQRKSLLIDMATPFMHNLHRLVEGSGFVIVLTDEQGCILQIDGDSGVLHDAQLFNMIPGAFMAEDSVGTNAMSLAIAEDRPIQLTAQEHFINAYHRWTCSSAPIHAPEGDVLGVLNLMGQKHQVHSHTLAVVVATVNAIEQQFRNLQLNADLRQTSAYLDAVINNLSYATLTIHTNGVISRVNRNAATVLGLEPVRLTGQPVRNYLPRWEEIWQIVRNGERMLDEEVTLENIPNAGRFVMSAMPIVSSKETSPDSVFSTSVRQDISEEGAHSAVLKTGDDHQYFLGVVLTFRDMKRVYNMVNKYTGMKAYYSFDDIIGPSAAMQRIIDFARRISDSPSTVLITGESGTGKEVFAQAIHNASSRRKSGFVAVNCGAIPEPLFESELFGYEDGAFTGARKGGKPGKFELANGGTLFLDEVGEMPMDMQVKLLRALQEGVVTRVGGNKTIPVDVRIVAATNKDLKVLVEQNKFRLDLYYRLSVIPIRIPPLRERGKDIRALIDFFLHAKSVKLNKTAPALEQDVITMLLRYEWPGNVRELENFIEKTVNLDGRIMLDVEDEDAFRNKYLHGITDVPQPAQPGLQATAPETAFEVKSLEEIEKEAIIHTLHYCNGNKTQAARILNISRNTLYLKAKHLGIALR